MPTGDSRLYRACRLIVPSSPPIVLGIGELLLDVFEDSRRPGGAPGNVAFHAAQIGNRGVVASRIGDDEDGRVLKAYLQDRNVDTTFLQMDQAHATGTVFVSFEDGEPSYRVSEEAAWDFLQPTTELLRLAASTDAICFATLGQRHETARATTQAVLAATRGIKVLDVNLRPPFVSAEVILASIDAADVVKISHSERDTLASKFSVAKPCDWLLGRGVALVCVTHGARGAELITANHTAVRGGIAIDVSSGDAVGVGDAFVAAMTHQLVRGASLETTLEVANHYAAQVASHRGGMPVIPQSQLAACLR